MRDTFVSGWHRCMRGGLLLSLCLTLSACGGGGGGGKNSLGNQSPSNAPPTATSLTATIAEDNPLMGNLQAQDPEGAALTFSISSQPAHGLVRLGAGSSFTYTPSANFFGTDQFTFSASDGRASAAATVAIQVTPVNDPPQFGAIGVPFQTVARARIELNVPVSDVDSPINSIVVEQLSGPSLGDLQVAGGKLVFNAPDTATVLPIALKFRTTDDQGASATSSVSFSVFPQSASGKLTTILGSANGPGIHLVITGDGFRAEELAALRTSAISLANFVLDTPEVQVYKPAFNVHVLDAVSKESGLDVPTENIARDTIFNATASCVDGIERLVCVDTNRVFDAVTQEMPAFDFVLVLVNTTRYGGSGGTLSVSTLNTDSNLIVLHELGHTLADLADEYVDAVAAPTFLPFYSESRFPNVTMNPLPEQTKWRHWFDTAPANVPRVFGTPGVGLFEGAYYQATGFFRPTSDSFMRVLQRVMGPVNTEAWALAIYDITGAVTDFQPQETVVTAAPGTSAAFSVVKLLPGSTQQVQWLVDGVERLQARNLERFNCCAELTGEHAITVRVSDVSGKVRTPEPRASRFERTWTLRIGQLP